MAEKFLSQSIQPCMYPDSKHLYAFGNTKANDMLLDYEVPEDQCDILLVGSGDIRHVIKTISGLSNRPTDLKHLKSVSFCINDFDAQVIARNILLLEIITKLDFKDNDDLLFLWGVWYNLELSVPHHDRLLTILKDLCGKTDLTHKFWTIPSRETSVKLQVLYHKWANASYSPKLVREARQRQLDLRQVGKDHLACHLRTVYCDINPPEDVPSHLEKFLATGCVHPVPSKIVPEGKGKVNPTMMRPGSDLWHVQYSLHPFSTYCPLNRATVDQSKGLTGACFKEFTNMIRDFKMGLHKCKVEIDFHEGEAYYFCKNTLDKSRKFDIIDTSNLADHVHLGFMNLLSCFIKQLKWPEKSVLFTEVMAWHIQSTSIPAYLRQNFGCAPEMYPLLLGARLVEDLEFGRTEPPSISMMLGERGDEIRMAWMAPLGVQDPPLTLNECPEILVFLKSQVSSCMPWRVSSHNAPTLVEPQASSTSRENRFPECASLLTLLNVVVHLSKSVQGGVDIVLTEIHTIFDENSYCAPYQKAWQALLATAGLSKQQDGKVLMVTMPVKFPFPDGPLSIGWAPISTAVVYEPINEEKPEADIYIGFSAEEDENKMRKHLFPVFAFSWSKMELTFPMLEEDYVKMKDNCEVAVASVPPFVSRMTNLKDVKVVPLECTQESTSHSENESDNEKEVVDQKQAKVVSVTENKDRYDVQVHVENKGGKITIDTKFIPEIRPTMVKLTVTTRSGETPTISDISLSFTSAIVPKDSKTKGDVICQFVKDRAVNQSPAALPLRKYSKEELKTTKSLEEELFNHIDKRCGFPGLPDINKGLKPTTPYLTLVKFLKTFFTKSKGLDMHVTFKGAAPSLTMRHRGFVELKGKPVLLVLVENEHLMSQLMDQGKLDQRTIERSVHEESLRNVNMEAHLETQKGNPKDRDLLLRYLMQNSLYLKQRDYMKDMWLFNSFLDLRFPLAMGILKDQIMEERRQDFAQAMLFNQLMGNMFNPFGFPGMLGGMPGMFGGFPQGFGGFPEAFRESRHRRHNPLDDEDDDDHGSGELLDACSNCGIFSDNPKKCSRCKRVKYCGQTCQKEHWKEHKKECKPQSK